MNITEGKGVEKDFLDGQRIAVSIHATLEDLVKPGESLFSVADSIEAEIIAAGAKPAFPVNLSLNNEAAHRTPTVGDELVFTTAHVVKVDFGVSVNGSIIDTARTIDLTGENAKLLEASEQALEDAVSVMRAGKKISEVGKVISDAITSRGFKPIENLCGHSISLYSLHDGEEIPNVERGNYVLQEGDVFAVEPFASTGSGVVSDDFTHTEIFMLVEPKNVRLDSSRKLLELIANDFGTLPFCKRWVESKMNSALANLALRDLLKQELLMAFPLLKDTKDSLVSQKEYTVIVETDSVKVLA
ncbi:MAG: type II methionyl aminopeptidase [Candidatus Micrarchaeota archaeon]